MRKSRTAYLDPVGNLCTRQEFEAFQTSGAYLLRKYRGDKLILTLQAASTWLVGDAPREHWMTFSVSVSDILTTDFEGAPLNEEKIVFDPGASKGFRTRREAEDYFEKLLLAHTSSVMTGDGKVREVGNQYAPPDPDVPVVSSDSPVFDLVGAW